jgi:hypothetical protein
VIPGVIEAMKTCQAVRHFMREPTPSDVRGRDLHPGRAAGGRVGRGAGADERPLPGLLAAGGTMGGLQAGPRSGDSGDLPEGAVFGLIAGETAVGAGPENRRSQDASTAGHA